MKIPVALLVISLSVCAENNQETMPEISIESEYIQDVDIAEIDDSVCDDQDRFNFQELDDFCIDHNVLDYITIEEPSAFMKFVRVIGCPILMAYLHTKEKLQGIWQWCEFRCKREGECSENQVECSDNQEETTSHENA